MPCTPWTEPPTPPCTSRRRPHRPDPTERFPFTKFLPPGVDAEVGGIRVARLAQALHDYRVVVVRAPAGSGKTTLLAGWATRAQGPVAWLRAELRAEVCTTVTGRADAADVLAELEAGDLFVARFRRSDGEAWRYHDLFADFLRDRLVRERGAAAVAELHRRAAAALPPLAALPHLIAAGEPEAAAERRRRPQPGGAGGGRTPLAPPRRRGAP